MPAVFQVVGGADVHLAYHLRLEGDWLRPPADPASWTGWWESIVASADLPGDVDEVTVRELAPIMTVVVLSATQAEDGGLGLGQLG